MVVPLTRAGTGSPLVAAVSSWAQWWCGCPWEGPAWCVAVEATDPLCPQGGQYRDVLPGTSGDGGTWGVSENTFCLNPPSWDETLMFRGLLQRGFG